MIGDTASFDPTQFAPPLEHEVHIWYASLVQPDAWYQRLVQTLSPDEHKRAKRFFAEHDRQHFVIARGILRDILGRYIGIDASECQFHYGKNGKPALAEIHHSPLRFNVSHSGEWALYAITNNWEVGVDIERLHAPVEAEKIAQRFFSTRENAFLETLPPSLRREAFFTYWTCKEAVVKAMGDAIFHSLTQIDIGIAPEKENSLVFLGPNDVTTAVAPWLLRKLIPPAGYAAALALEGGREQYPAPVLITRSVIPLC